MKRSLLTLCAATVLGLSSTIVVSKDSENDNWKKGQIVFGNETYTENKGNTYHFTLMEHPHHSDPSSHPDSVGNNVVEFEIKPQHRPEPVGQITISKELFEKLESLDKAEQAKFFKEFMEAGKHQAGTHSADTHTKK